MPGTAEPAEAPTTNAHSTGEVLLGIARANREDLVIIREALRARWDILTKEEAKSFSIGQKVFFIKAGRRIEGIVMKVNRKTVNIEVDPFTSYRVSPSFLKVIA